MTSTATAQLDFYKAKKVSVPAHQDFSGLGQHSNNILLNSTPGPLDQVAPWSTSGFDIAWHGVHHNTGPLDDWVNVSALISPDATIAQKVQIVEVFLHTTLIAHLDAITNWAFIQDPPANVLVTDPNGLQTGFLAPGQIVENIAGSEYVSTPSGNGVIILDPADGVYHTKVIGDPGEAFSLSQGFVAGAANTAVGPFTHTDEESGTIGANGENSFDFTIQAPAPPPPSTAILSGFSSQIFPGNDDGSTGSVPLGFTADFFGTNYNSLFVNNNGNVTFDSPLSTFTPFDLSSTHRVIIAPLFADVDTRVGNAVTYGMGTVNGHPAFGVTWPGVGHYSVNTTKLDTFQVVLIDRSDTGNGNFDIELNYGQIQWETGDASGGSNGLGGSSVRAGFSNGTGQPGTFLELPGSAVNGASWITTR